jgi:hypothetical protein
MTAIWQAFDFVPPSGHTVLAQAWAEIVQPYGITGLIVGGVVLIARMALKHKAIPETIDALTRRRQQKQAEKVENHRLQVERIGDYLVSNRALPAPAPQLLELPEQTGVRQGAFQILEDHEDRLRALENQGIVITAQLEREDGHDPRLKLRNKSPTDTATGVDVRVVTAGATVKVTPEGGVTLGPGERIHLDWPLLDDGAPSYDIAVSWRERGDLRTRRMTIWSP